MGTVVFEDLGQMNYQDAWDYQESLLKKNVGVKAAGGTGDTINYLLFVEHPPVYTLGKSGHAENILIDEEGMAARGVQFFKTNRGGDITFHGPGQLVGYPILDLEKFRTDLGWYLRSLEEVGIRVLGRLWYPRRAVAGRNGDLDRYGHQGAGAENMCDGCTMQPLDYDAWFCAECEYGSFLVWRYHSLWDPG